MAWLDRALADSGLTQAEFAAALATSASRFSTYRSGRTRPTAAFCFRARRIAEGLAAARRTRVMSAPVTAKIIRDAEDEDWAWRMLLQGRDHLRMLLEDGDAAVSSWEAVPPSTGSAAFDTLLAVLTRREFDAAGIEAPVWCRPKRLPEAWIPRHPFLTHVEVIAKTPEFLKELNVFVPARDLVTA
ncbi:helix-turn-helix transcriptional regulator [Frankia sp. AgB1.9]|nr:helix-turn-helix transcriptional regulator [Frankia sp. AgW1.1]MBL7546745.1 helix-turn-helix transcriptional regulator [Frankia sp. AgB1.9]MBL7621839.1 helix-turn-helix transcriptional regulator [Frankia sp. AgB1.8]